MTNGVLRTLRTPSAYGEYPATGPDPVEDPPAPGNDNAPSFTVHQQMAVPTGRMTWTEPQVDRAIQAHDEGNFALSAMLMETMTRDDAIDAVVSARVDGLLGLPRDIEPSKQGQKVGGKRIAKDIAARFDELFPFDVLRQLKLWEIFMGFAVAQLVWKANEDASEWAPEIEPWHPCFLRVDPNTGKYWAQTMAGEVEVIQGTGQWLLYAPHGRKNGYRTGAIRSLATPWLARGYAWRDWCKWSETYSQGIRKAWYPQNADAAKKRKFFGEVRALGSETTVGLERGATPNENYDLEVIFPESSSSSDGYDKLMSKAESKIAIRVNGQNLTTEVKGGAYAAAVVHENVKNSILQGDSTSIGECLARDVVVPWIGWHDYPEKTKPPSIRWDTDPPEDKKAQADVLGAVGDAISKFGAAQVPASVPKIMERFDIPVADTPEEMPKAPILPPAPGGPNAGPPGQQKEPSANDPNAPGSKPPPGDGKPKPPPPSPAPTMNSLARASSAPPEDGIDYADKVAERAALYAGAAQKPYLERVLAGIQEGETFEDVRTRVLEAYRAHKTDPRVVEALRAAHVMTTAAGVFDVAEKANEQP